MFKLSESVIGSGHRAYCTDDDTPGEMRIDIALWAGLGHIGDKTIFDTAKVTERYGDQLQ